MKIEDIESILSHFPDQIQLFPRKMMTFSKPWQFSVSSVKEIFEQCKNSDFIDCRINAYPEYTEFKGIIRQPPNLIFIDLDLANFKMNRKNLDLRLKRTLKKIEEYNGFPTVLWTGNGYHIYLPINAIVLDQESIFLKERFPNLFSAIGRYSNWSISEVFLKYAEIFFTKGKADPQHRPKYKTCLIRISGCYNSKLLNRGLSKEESLIKIVQKWNGIRIPIQCLLKDFRRWIVQEEYNQRIESSQRRVLRSITRKSNTYPWIENLLQISLDDHRKYCIFHILVPYLVNVRGLSSEEVKKILGDWLSKCNKENPLNFNHVAEIERGIKYVRNFRPMSLAKLQTNNKDLYRILSS